MKYNLIKFSNGEFGVRRYDPKYGCSQYYVSGVNYWLDIPDQSRCFLPENEARIILEELRNPNSPPTYEVIE